MKVILLLVGLCCFTKVAGQSGYRNGILFTTRHDTIRGLIRYAENVGISVPCLYKANPQTAIVEYPPGTISGFRYNNDQYFISRSIGKSADVFLEVLVKGHMSLYKFHDIYFIEKGDSAFFELSDGMERVLVEGEQIKKRSRNFTRMLALLMADCMEASRKVPSVPLKKKSLVKLVSSYNTCMGSPNFYYRKR